MGLDVRKPDLVACEQQICRPAVCVVRPAPLIILYRMYMYIIAKFAVFLQKKQSDKGSSPYNPGFHCKQRVKSVRNFRTFTVLLHIGMGENSKFKKKS